MTRAFETARVTLLVLATVGLLATGAPAFDWVSTPAIGGDYAQNGGAIAVDADGTPHVVLSDNGVLAYGVLEGGTWSVEHPDPWRTSTPREKGIAVDSNGTVHVAYFDDAGQHEYLMYLKKTASGWSVEELASGVTGDTSKLALDSQGNVWITWSKQIQYIIDWEVRVTTNASGSWHTEVVQVHDFRVECPSIAFDSNDVPHLSYNVAGDEQLWYANKAGGTWSSQVAHVTGWTEVSTSIALDGSGDVHIAHTVFQGTQGQVWYSTKSGGSWSHELIEASEGGATCSLALDSAGRPIVVYSFSEDPAVLRCAIREAGGWALETADAGGAGGCGYRASLALDAFGGAHVVHSNRNTIFANLRYSYGTPASTSVAGGIPAGEASVRLGEAHPNPMAKGTRLEFSVAEDGPVRVEVIDVAGRRVRALADRSVSAGQHGLTWDGLDDRGRPVGPGVYWIRLDSAGEARSRRVAVVR